MNKKIKKLFVSFWIDDTNFFNNILHFKEGPYLKDIDPFKIEEIIRENYKSKSNDIDFWQKCSIVLSNFIVMEVEEE